MIIVHISQCRPGMKLGRSICTEQGHVLAGRGFLLTESALNRLKQMGLPYLHIEQEGTDDIAPDQAITDETIIVLHGALTHIMDELFDRTREKLSASVAHFCHDAVKLLVGDLRAHKNELCLPVHLSTTLSDGEKQHFLEHAINVAVCAARLGIEENLASDELHALTMGAMLHDIGRLMLPNGLQSRATQSDRAQYLSHTELGYRLLRDSGFPALTAQCALFHHERMDGSGYPFGMEGERIHAHHQWISIFDMFDTLVNGRSNGVPMLPHEALEVLFGGAGTLYDMKKVCNFRDNMALFPRGMTVRLSTGEVGIVSDVHEDSKQRPIVRVIRNSNGDSLLKPYDVDLKQQLHLMINGIGSDKVIGESLLKPTLQGPSPSRTNELFHVV
ncbi:MAG: HD domain-containing protein [Candidatus Cohnella colombiensis]|uniref:HD domain-containing protein n=1 Tax=Candidatus Cohnella colombiensis TaxID=3121368 RepID=A0AA95EXL1_9BACL|nr:MAG: HD domain-containing protein [Cohnella sp.]